MQNPFKLIHNTDNTLLYNLFKKKQFANFLKQLLVECAYKLWYVIVPVNAHNCEIFFTGMIHTT